MSKYQTEIKECISDIAELLDCGGARSVVNNFGEFEKLYNTFVHRVWSALPSQDSQGCALAAAACMPVWELINFFSGMYGPLENAQKAFAVQLLTSMYPKSKDRRCLYQQLNCTGNDAATAIPLSTMLPHSTEYFCYSSSEGVSEHYKTVIDFISNSIKLESFCASSANANSGTEAFDILMSKVLPLCVLVERKANFITGKIVIEINDKTNSPCSLRTFLSVLWKYLIFGELHCSSHAKELAAFLTSSSWASQIVRVDDKPVRYSSFFLPLVDTSMVCLSVSARTPSTSSDNIPLIDPRIVLLLRSVEASVLYIYEGSGVYINSPFSSVTVQERGDSLMSEKDRSLNECLLERIPQEVDFSGSSSTARDCDQVTMLCRGLIFSPFSLQQSLLGGNTSLFHSLVFSRKRSRSGKDCVGPSFLPVKSTMSDILESERKDLNSLEFICCSQCNK